MWTGLAYVERVALAMAVSSTRMAEALQQGYCKFCVSNLFAVFAIGDNKPLICGKIDEVMYSKTPKHQKTPKKRFVRKTKRSIKNKKFRQMKFAK